MTSPPPAASPTGSPAASAAPDPTDYHEAHPDRQRLYEIIFGHDTPAGKTFDVALIALILVSIVAVSLETLSGLPRGVTFWLRRLEWVLTVAFTLEYVLRLMSVRRPRAYAGSFFGIIDLLAILPTYISLLFPGAQTLLVVRVLRLLRVFRVLKLSRYLREARTLSRALRASGRKIAVFLLVVGTIVVVIGSLMYVIEGAENGFTSLPTSMYWAIVTLTTVGYGDIAPKTPLGQMLASLVMILGYAIIAVPTGIVTVELAQTGAAEAREQSAAAAALRDTPCRSCGATGHGDDALFCRRCGARIAAGG